MITIRCDECSEVFFDSRDERRSNLEQLATDTPFEDDMVMCLDCMDEIFEEDEKTIKVKKPVEKVLRMKEIKELSREQKISTLFDLRTLLQTEIFTNCWYDEMKKNGDIDHDDEELLDNVNAILYDYLKKQWRTE